MVSIGTTGLQLNVNVSPGVAELIFGVSDGGLQPEDAGTYQCVVEDASFCSAAVNVTIYVLGKNEEVVVFLYC